MFARNIPQSVPTFLVDGQVAGTWRYIEGEVRCEPFKPLHSGVAREVEAEAGRLAAFHGVGLMAGNGAQVGELPLLVAVLGGSRELGRAAGPHDRQRDESGHEEENDDR